MNLAWAPNSVKFKSSGTVATAITTTTDNILTVSGTSASVRASIRNVAEPTDNTDAATKYYVDNNGGGGAVLTNSSEQTKSGILNLSYNEESTSPSTGALRITDGGLGVHGNTTIGGQMTAIGNANANQFLTTSDVTMKRAICDIDDPLKKIGMIQSAEYELKNDNSGRKIYGVLAQQLEEVGLSNIVHEGSSHKTVDYNSIIGLLVAGINELTLEVKNLKSINEDKSN
jgi:hypothetical protein